VLSFWDWDGDSSAGIPALDSAFEVAPIPSVPFTLNGKTLTSSGTTGTFAGVTMPNSFWSDNGYDDGDLFTPLARPSAWRTSATRRSR